MKKRPQDLSQSERIKTLDTLYTAAASVHGRTATKLFLRDLLTESERIMLGRRIWIARLILRGETYDDIASQLGVGMATIYRIERWLNDQLPGYEEAIKGLEVEFADRERKYESRKNPFTLASLKKRYPLHFLLFPESKRK